MRWFLAFVLLVCALGAQARMYQWVSPQTGTVQMSGKPPAWYRSGEDGPRVVVYDRGRVVDDTAVPVPAERREALRDLAFRELEARRQDKALEKLGQVARREAARRAREKSAAASGSEETGPGARPETESPGDLDPATVRQLKAIIAEWDRLNPEAEAPAESSSSRSAREGEPSRP